MRWRYVKRFQLTWSPALACLHADTIKFMFRLPESGMWIYLSVLLLYKFTNKFNLLCKFTKLEMTFLLTSSCSSGQCNFISATALYRCTQLNFSFLLLAGTQLPRPSHAPLPCPSHATPTQLPYSSHTAPTLPHTAPHSLQTAQTAAKPQPHSSLLLHAASTPSRENLWCWGNLWLQKFLPVWSWTGLTKMNHSSSRSVRWMTVSINSLAPLYSSLMP